MHIQFTRKTVNAHCAHKPRCSPSTEWIRHSLLYTYNMDHPCECDAFICDNISNIGEDTAAAAWQNELPFVATLIFYMRSLHATLRPPDACTAACTFLRTAIKYTHLIAYTVATTTNERACHLWVWPRHGVRLCFVCWLVLRLGLWSMTIQSIPQLCTTCWWRCVQYSENFSNFGLRTHLMSAGGDVDCDVGTYKVSAYMLYTCAHISRCKRMRGGNETTGYPISIASKRKCALQSNLYWLANTSVSETLSGIASLERHICLVLCTHIHIYYILSFIRNNARTCVFLFTVHDWFVTQFA